MYSNSFPNFLVRIPDISISVSAIDDMQMQLDKMEAAGTRSPLRTIGKAVAA